MATEQSGEDKAARLRVGIIAGSTRPGRQSRTVAEWVCADPIPSLDLRLIDLADSGLPLLSGRHRRVRPVPAACHAIVVAADRDVRRVRPGHAGVQPFDERSLEERARSPLPGMARQARRVRWLRSRRRNPRRRAPSCHRCRAGNGRSRPAGGDQPACRLRRRPPRTAVLSARGTQADARPARSLGNGAAGSSAAHHIARGTKPSRARRSLSKGSGHQRG